MAHHYFDGYWRKFYSGGDKIFLAADDKYIWEMLHFSNVKNTGSQSFVFQHGKMSDVYYPTPAKTFCAWGNLDRQRMIMEFEALEHEIISVGSPYFDKVFNLIKKTKSVPKQEREFVSFLGQPLYTYAAAAPYYATALSWFYKLSQKEHINKKFIIKPHPHDHLSYYESRPNNVVLITENIIQVMEKSLITFTVDSTSMLEASVIFTPSIQLLPIGNTTFSDDSETKISLKAETYAEFEALVYKLYDDPEFYQKTIEESSQALHLYFNNLGHSLENIKELISGHG